MIGERAAAVRGMLRAEDILLVAWVFVAFPLLAAALGADAFELGADHPPLVAVLYLVAAAGAIACLLTRGRSEPIRETGTALTPATYARFPFMVAVGIVAGEGAESLGFRVADQLLGLAFVAGLVGFMAPAHLPVLEPGARRLLVAPIVVVGSSIFETFAADIWSGIGPGDVAAGFDGAEGGSAAFVLLLLVGGTAAFYTMLVYAPRQIAEAEGSWAAWVLRFGLFQVSVVLGVGWLRVLA